jgi:hypothetical protein
MNKKMIFTKKNLRLLEGEYSNAYVNSSSDNVSSLSSDLNKTKAQNPTDDTFVINANSYDGNAKNDTVTLDINSDSPTDASQQFQKLKQNPQVKNLMANNNVNAKIHLHNESVQKLQESSVMFTKKEIKEMFNKK